MKLMEVVNFSVFHTGSLFSSWLYISQPINRLFITSSNKKPSNKKPAWDMGMGLER